MLPIIRTFISLPAGVARMPFWRFTVFTAGRLHPLGARAGVVGSEVGEQLGHVEGPAALPRLRGGRWPIVALIVYLLIRRRRGRRQASPDARAPSGRRGAARSEDEATSRAHRPRRRVQGPTELLPGLQLRPSHPDPLARRLGLGRPGPELRKSFEVALHAGAAAALLVGQRRVIAEELRSFDRRKAAVLALSFLPPAICGVALERPIERRLGGPLPTAVGLLAGARRDGDRRPPAPGPRPGRRPAVDGLALGLAQAAALAPGVSRNGATLTAARWRGFTAQHANMLSRTVALPVIVGAAVLKGIRLRRRGLPAEARAGFAAGTADLVRLHARLPGADPAGRARQRALALRRLPRRARRPVVLGQAAGAERSGLPAAPRPRLRRPVTAPAPHRAATAPATGDRPSQPKGRGPRARLPRGP